MKNLFYILVLLAIATIIIVPVSSQYTNDTYPLDGKGPAFNASAPGERNAGQWYDFSLQNVTGYQDVVYHFTVYDAEIKDSYEYRSDSWGQWWTQEPDRGKKFLFVWICGWSEGTTWIGWGSERFFAWVDRLSITPESVIFSDIRMVRRGSTLTSDVPPRTIRWLEENKTSYLDFPWSDDAYSFMDGVQMIRQEPGKSNAMQGYLIYQVPEITELKDIRIAGWFGYYGTAWWNLEQKTFVQNSTELNRQTRIEQLQEERLTGKRMPGNRRAQERARG